MRLFIFLTVIPSLFVVLSCSSLSTETYSNDVEGFFVLYKKARELEKSDNTVEKIQSCETYKKLSKEEKFPLHKVALVRAKYACDRILAEVSKQKRVVANAEELTSVEASEFQSQIQENWLKETYTALGEADLKANTENIPPPPPTDYFAQSRLAFTQRKFSVARTNLQKVLSAKNYSDEDKYRARKQIRQSYKVEQKKELYLTECEKLAKSTLPTKKADRIHEAYVTYARALWTQGFPDKARKQLEFLDKKLDKKFPRDEIFAIRARMAEEVKDWELALSFYNKAEKAMRTTNERVLFGKAWTLRKMGRHQEAGEAFTKLKAIAKDFVDKNKYSFWLARTFKELNLNYQATQEYEELAKKDNLGYYGLLAYRDLNKPLPAIRADRSPASAYAKFASGVDKDTRTTVRALQYAEEDIALEKYLIERSGTAFSEASVDETLFYLHSFSQIGSYIRVFTRLPFMSEKVRDAIVESYPELAFPKRYAEFIEPTAGKFGIPKELVFSIIRQESAFNAQARSPADAFGLMQILPMIARVHSKKADAPWKKFEELYEPQTNIALGTSLLKTLHTRYNGQFIPIVASYNASHTAVEGWMQTRYHEDPLEFIEDIPYEETKGYVKMVMRNFVFYSRMSQPGIPVLFPEWCLQNIRPTKVSTIF